MAFLTKKIYLETSPMAGCSQDGLRVGWGAISVGLAYLVPFKGTPRTKPVTRPSWMPVRPASPRSTGDLQQRHPHPSDPPRPGIQAPVTLSPAQES